MNSPILMANSWVKIILAGIIPLCLAQLTVRAQYSIGWFTMAGGGGTSVGGVYTISGTIGQTDAGGPLTGGNYALTGGFWALPIAVQTIDAPTLRIVPRNPGLAIISWSPPTPGFVLQQSDGRSLPNWSNAPSGAANPITVPATFPANLYRLRKP